MKNTMILVSGLPAAGKTTFADWLSSEIYVPLICRDRVQGKCLEIGRNNFESVPLSNEEYNSIFASGGSLPSVLYWFFCEEIMKSSSPLIIESVFITKEKEIISGLIQKYNYKTVNVHFDASIEVIHHRFNDRIYNNIGVGNNVEKQKEIEIPFEFFKKEFENDEGMDVKNFRYGDCIIYVDTTDFSMVSYTDIAEQIQRYTRPN
jgi:cytidylate kinase